MSLEQALAANTAALEALTAVMAGAKINAPAASTGGTKGTPVVTGPSKDPKPSGKAGKAEPESKAESEGPSAADLTQAIARTVAATSRDAVIDLLGTQFKVKAGKEITDPAVRAQAIAALDELVANESMG